MALSGPDALRALEDALRDIRREEDDIARRLARSGEIIARLREHEGELIRDIIGERLTAPLRDLLASGIEMATTSAAELMHAHDDELAATAARLLELDNLIGKIAAQRSTLEEEAAEHDAELTAMAIRVRPSLTQRSDYSQAVATADELARIANESLRKTIQAETDRELKGRPYRDDRLFMYLWERGYGTRNYRDNPVMTWLDGLVARLVGFAEARPNFAMLNEIPLRLREHAARQADMAHAAAAAVAALENDAIDAAGGKAIRAALDHAIARIVAIDEQIVRHEDYRDEAARTQRDLAQGSDPAYSAAISGLSKALGREEINVMMASARASGDNVTIQQIDDARQRVRDESFETGEQKSRLRTLATRRRELEDLIFEMKQHGFDNPRSTFSVDALVADQLTGFLRGTISAAGYWEQWRRAQSWAGSILPAISGEEAGHTARRNSPGFGGPGGGWGRYASPVPSNNFSRPRGAQAAPKQAART